MGQCSFICFCLLPTLLGMIAYKEAYPAVQFPWHKHYMETGSQPMSIYYMYDSVCTFTATLCTIHLFARVPQLLYWHFATWHDCKIKRALCSVILCLSCLAPPLHNCIHEFPPIQVSFSTLQATAAMPAFVYLFLFSNALPITP